MKWQTNNMVIKIFLVGMVATLVYKYMQSKTNTENLIPPQLTEIDRPLANGRMEFWQADALLQKIEKTGGNGPRAKALAETFAAALGASPNMRIYCMVNDANYVFLVKSTAALDEKRAWAKAREVALAEAEGVPTIGVGVRGPNEYNLVIVGGPDPNPILVKSAGPFTLYPYFYRAQNLNADAAR